MSWQDKERQLTACWKWKSLQQRGNGQAVSAWDRNEALLPRSRQSESVETANGLIGEEHLAKDSVRVNVGDRVRPDSYSLHA